MAFAFFEQLSTFFILGVMGYLLRKFNILHKETSRDLSRFLVIVVLPILIVDSLLRPYDPQEAKEIAMICIFSLIIQLIFIAVAFLLFDADHAVERFAVSFGNKGFVGVPLVMAILGEKAVFYVAPAIMISNVIIRAYGDVIIGEKGKKHSLWDLFKNPATLGFFFGLFFYLLPIPIPSVLKKSVQSIVSFNSPLAMILLGTFVADAPLQNLFTDSMAWAASAIRLLLLPMIVIGALKLFPFGPRIFQLSMVIAWGCPAAVNTMLQASISDKNPYHASQVVVSSTLASVFTLPFMYWIATQIL